MNALPDYSFTSNFHAHHHGARQHFLDEGQGPAVLMLHGNPSWSYLYRRLVLGLRGGYRCIVPDHIGMGLSDKPDDARYEYSLRQRVEDLEALWQHLVTTRGVPATDLTLVLHDWGGMIGMAWAAQHPERIARLVILNTAAFPMPADKRLPFTLKLGRESALGAALITRCNAFARGATRMGVVRRLPRDVRRAFVAPYDTLAHRIATLRFVQDIPLGPTDRSYAQVVATASALPQFADRPTLICWGLRDFVFDHTFLRTWQGVLPHAEVHAFDDAGHYVLEDAHERIVPLVRDFLGRHGPL